MGQVMKPRVLARRRLCLGRAWTALRGQLNQILFVVSSSPAGPASVATDACQGEREQLTMTPVLLARAFGRLQKLLSLLFLGDLGGRVGKGLAESRAVYKTSALGQAWQMLCFFSFYLKGRRTGLPWW